MLSHKNPYECLIFPRIHAVFVTIIAHPTAISDNGLQSLDNIVLDRNRNTAFSKRTAATPSLLQEELCRRDIIPLCPFNQTTTAVPATGYPWPVPRSFWRGFLSGESISPCRSADVPRHQ